MRRKDREMGVDFALKVIDDSEFGVMGICKDEIYTMPLSIVREDMTLYYHSAPAGRKVEMIEDGDYVSVSFVSYVKVPKILDKDEIREKINLGKMSELGSKVFTTEFKSAHVTGKIYEVTNEEEMIHALKLIAKKYTEEFYEFAEDFIKNSLHRTRVYKIEIQDIKGKRKKFGKNKEELKFQKEE